MTVRHPGISPTNDLVAKKIFSNPEITCQFIRDMLDLPAKNVTILEGSNIHVLPSLPYSAQDFYTSIDDLAFHSFSMREDTTGEVLTITNNGQENHLVKMAFLELKKYRETSKDEVRKPWLEFFGNKPFTQEPERAISQADQLLDYKSWSEEDRKMFSQLRMREEQALLAHDYALEQAEEKGLERGLEQGLERGKFFAFLDMVHQGLLTAEVASEQLGMTVAEFESLLKDYH